MPVSVSPYTLRSHTRPRSRPGTLCRPPQPERARCRSCIPPPGSWENKVLHHLHTHTHAHTNSFDFSAVLQILSGSVSRGGWGFSLCASPVSNRLGPPRVLNPLLHLSRKLFVSSFRPLSVNSDVCNSTIWNRLSSFYDKAGFIKIPPLFTLIFFDTRSGVDLYKQMTKPEQNSPACHVLSRKVGGLDTGFIIMRRIERSICKDIFGKQNNQRTSSWMWLDPLRIWPHKQWRRTKMWTWCWD